MRILHHVPRPAVPAGGNPAVRYTLRFFAAILILTLAARGTSAAAMAQVTLGTAGQGTIVQQTETSAELRAEDSVQIPLPAGVTVERLCAAEGQMVEQGECMAELDTKELQRQLDGCLADRERQQAQLAALEVPTDSDDSSVRSAEQTLAQAREDYDRTDARTRTAVDDAAAAQQQARQSYDEAADAWGALQACVDPPVPEEEIAAAKQTMESAAAALETADRALRDAQNSRDDALLSAQRAIDNAQTALDQADRSQTLSDQQAELTDRSNRAQASALRLEMADTEEKITLLQSLLDSEGAVTAPWDAQILLCTLAENQSVPDGVCLRLSVQDSALQVEFTLPSTQAELLTRGQTATVSQGTVQQTCTVQTVAPADEAGNCKITAALDEAAAGLRQGSPASVQITFSRTEYGCCVPVTALHQDSGGSYLLALNQTENLFGIANTVERVPVTVLETDSEGQTAAVQGNVPRQVVVSSDRAVTPGASVRIAA